MKIDLSVGISVMTSIRYLYVNYDIVKKMVMKLDLISYTYIYIHSKCAIFVSIKMFRALSDWDVNLKWDYDSQLSLEIPKDLVKCQESLLGKMASSLRNGIPDHHTLKKIRVTL